MIEKRYQTIESEVSPGVIIVSQRLAISKAARLLHLLWAAGEPEDHVNVIYELGDLD